MRSKFSAEPEVVCPFYIRGESSKASIICEGHTDCNNNIMRFDNLKARAPYMNSYCADNYKMCAVYRMVYECKYSEV